MVILNGIGTKGTFSYTFEGNPSYTFFERKFIFTHSQILTGTFRDLVSGSRLCSELLYPITVRVLASGH